MCDATSVKPKCVSGFFFTKVVRWILSFLSSSIVSELASLMSTSLGCNSHKRHTVSGGRNDSAFPAAMSETVRGLLGELQSWSWYNITWRHNSPAQQLLNFSFASDVETTLFRLRTWIHTHMYHVKMKVGMTVFSGTIVAVFTVRRWWYGLNNAVQTLEAVVYQIICLSFHITFCHFFASWQL